MRQRRVAQAAAAMVMPPTKSQYFPLVGGLDVESAQLSRQPGLVMAASNYESSAETGYERMGGFERFDGRARPSDAVFSVLKTASGGAGVAVNDTITGATSGATAKVIQVRVDGASGAPAVFVVTRQVGTFTAGENIQVGGVTMGVYSTLADDFSSVDDNTFSALAASDYRASIAAVPGSGATYIGWIGTICYAFRDNVPGTTRLIYKSSAAGWTAVALKSELSFTAGSVAPVEGAGITKGAVTAVVRRIVVQSGSWGAGTAAGRLIVDTIVGGPFTAGAFTAGITATCSGAEAAIVIAPGGRMEMENYNFTGSTATERLYGCDGVNRGFEFDGTTYVPIVTGMTVDKPVHMAVFKNHLFYSFGGSVQHSGIGAPYIWSVVFGAAEIAIGQDVTAFQVPPGNASSGALMIFSLGRSMVLYGNASTDWKLDTFTPYVGAQSWSVQNIGSPIVFDAQGISVVAQAQEFGNFTRSPISNRIRRALVGKTVTASVVSRAKNRMRLFFSDGEGLSITSVPTRNGEMLAFMPFNYGKTVSFACEAVVSGVARNFFTSTDGFVYEADRGRSFDGATVIGWAKLAFNIAKSPGVKKRFRWADIEVKTQSATTLQVQGEFSLGDIDVGLTDVYSKAIAGTGGQYDVSNWDQCYYDVPAQSSNKYRLDGTGTSLSLTFYSDSASELPHELQSSNVFYSLRRLDRG